MIIKDDFDPNKINFDIEVNELSLRYSALKRAIKDLTEDDNFLPSMRLDVIVNLQAEASHIIKILKIIYASKST